MRLFIFSVPSEKKINKKEEFYELVQFLSHSRAMIKMKIVVSPFFLVEILSINRYIHEHKYVVYHLPHNSLIEEEEESSD